MLDGIYDECKEIQRADRVGPRGVRKGDWVGPGKMAWVDITKRIEDSSKNYGVGACE